MLRARAERLVRRRDQDGRDHASPGFQHDVFSAWHPLWVGGAAHAQLGDELARARARVPEHRAADGDARTRTARAPSCCAPPRRTPPSSTGTTRATATPGTRCSRSSSRTPTSRSACSAPSSGRGTALALGAKAVRRLGRAGAAEFAGSLLVVGARLARDGVRVGARARPARALGAAHGSRARRRGLRLHGAGDRGRGAGGRHADPARRRREARRRARRADPRRTAARARPACDVERVVSSARGVRTRRAATIVTAARAVICERDADAALRAPARRPTRARRRERFRYGRVGDADPLRALRAAAVGGRRAARRDGDRARDAGARRRLARRQRGRARPAARRGDGRRRASR